MNNWVQYLAAVMGMASADGAKDVAHLIHYRKLFVFIVCHCLFLFYGGEVIEVKGGALSFQSFGKLRDICYNRN